MKKNKNILVLLTFSWMVSFFKNSPASEPSIPASGSTAIEVLRFIGGNLSVFSALKMIGYDFPKNVAVKPALNFGADLITESWKDPNVAKGVGTSLALLAGAHYLGADKPFIDVASYITSGAAWHIYNVATGAKDMILCNEKITDLMSKNNQIKYTMTFEITPNANFAPFIYNSDYNSKKDIFEDLWLHPAGSHVLNLKKFNAFKLYTDSNYMPEKTALEFIIREGLLAHNAITQINLKTTLTIDTINRTLSSKSITDIPLVRTTQEVEELATKLYEIYVQPIVTKKIHTQAKDLAITSAEEQKYQFAIKPFSLFKKSLAKFSAATLAYPVQNYLPTLITDRFTLERYNPEDMRDEFKIWAKKHITAPTDGKTSPVVPWIIEPTYTAQWPTENKENTYKLQNQIILFGPEQLATIQKKITGKEAHLSTMIAQSAILNNYHKTIKTEYATLFAEIKKIWDLTDQLKELKKLNQASLLLNQLALNNVQILNYTRAYESDLNKISVLSIANLVGAGNLSNGWTVMFNLLNPIANPLMVPAPQNIDLLKLIIHNLEDFISLKTFEVIKNASDNILKANPLLNAGNNQNANQATIHKINQIAQSIYQQTDRIITNCNNNVANQEKINLKSFRYEIKSLNPLINSSLLLNINKNILDTAGLKYIDALHKEMDMPKSLDSFIHNPTEELYADVIFDLYIKPIFT